MTLSLDARQRALLEHMGLRLDFLPPPRADDGKELALAPLTDEAAAEVPPRTIGDIQALLNQYEPDPKRVEALKFEFELPPPENADLADLSRHYERHAWAADQLGRTEERLAALRDLVRISQGMPNEATYKIELALAEIQSGNNLNALKLYEGLIANPKSQPGTLVSANFALARMYALMADKPNMQAAFRRGEATLERVRIFPAARPFLPSWFALREWARGELFLAQGKLDEAESALRRSVRSEEHTSELQSH